MVGARAQLRVFSAGVWHNIVLGGLAWLANLALPLTLSPLYFHALTVVDTLPNSGVGGEAGLKKGDVLLAIQGRKVDDMSAYREVLAMLVREEDGGFCVEPRLITELSKAMDRGKCCDEGSAGSLCFSKKESEEFEYYCLPVRPLLRIDKLHCRNSDGCEDQNMCLYPLLEGNSTRLIIADRQNQQQLIFLGSPGEMYQSVQLTKYSPRVAFLPLSLPDQLAKLLRYTFSISFALALLNIVPCYLLDGHHIASAIISLMPVTLSTKHMATFLITCLGTALVAINIALGLLAVIRDGRLSVL